MKDDIRDRYIEVVGEQYASGVIDEGGLEEAIDYLLMTDDGPRKAREYLNEHYGIGQMALLPDAEPLTIRM